jgi:hypothetical protein
MVFCNKIEHSNTFFLQVYKMIKWLMGCIKHPND